MWSERGYLDFILDAHGGCTEDATGQLLFKRKDCKNVSHSCSRLLETVYIVMASGGDRTIRQEAVRMLELTSSRVLQNPHRSWSHLQWRGIQGKACQGCNKLKSLQQQSRACKPFPSGTQDSGKQEWSSDLGYGRTARTCEQLNVIGCSKYPVDCISLGNCGGRAGDSTYLIQAACSLRCNWQRASAGVCYMASCKRVSASVLVGLLGQETCDR